MDMLAEVKEAPTKSKQANVRLTEEQARLLRQHCVRTGLSTQDAIVAALRRVIEGF
jgi:hypothetical protein